MYRCQHHPENFYLRTKIFPPRMRIFLYEIRIVLHNESESYRNANRHPLVSLLSYIERWASFRVNDVHRHGRTMYIVRYAH